MSIVGCRSLSQPSIDGNVAAFCVIYGFDARLHLQNCAANRFPAGGESHTTQTFQELLPDLGTFGGALVHAVLDVLPQEVIACIQVRRVSREVEGGDAEVPLGMRGAVALVPGGGRCLPE